MLQFITKENINTILREIQTKKYINNPKLGWINLNEKSKKKKKPIEEKLV